MDLTTTNLKAESGKLLDKIDASITASESEKLYYQVLALKELDIIKRNQMQLLAGGNLTLLSPTNATPGDPRIFQNQQYNNDNQYHVANAFGWTGGSRVHHNSSHGADPSNAKLGVHWGYGKGDNDYCMLKKYIIGTWISDPPGSWFIDVSMDSTTGLDGTWILVDTANGVNPGNSQMVERVITEPVACKWIRFNCTGTSTGGSSLSIGTFAFHGTEHLEIT